MVKPSNWPFGLDSDEGGLIAWQKNGVCGYKHAQFTNSNSVCFGYDINIGDNILSDIFVIRDFTSCPPPHVKMWSPISTYLEHEFRIA